MIFFLVQTMFFKERLYCIRWVETIIDDEDKTKNNSSLYRALNADDLQREDQV